MVQDTNPLNIKAKCQNIQSGIRISFCILDDIASQSGLSIFGTVKHFSGTRSSSLSYDSNQQAYKLVTGSGNNHSFFPINALTGIKNIHFEMDIKSGGSYSYPGFVVYYWGSDAIDSESTYKQVHYRGITGYNGWIEGFGTGMSTYKTTQSSVSSNTWYHIIVDIDNYECSYKLYNANQTVLLYSDTRILYHGEDYTPYYGIICGYDGGTTKYYKNIKAIIP